jgi:hypothetical protein
MTEVNIFTFLNQIQLKNDKIKYDKKIAPAFILSHWLSMDKEIINEVNDIIKYQFMIPDDVIYKYYMNIIPKKKRYIKFVKKRKEEDIKKKIDELKEKYPEMSIRECKIILNSLKNR